MTDQEYNDLMNKLTSPIQWELELEFCKRADDLAIAMSLNIPTLRPAVSRSDFIEQTVQSLASGYSYGNVPNYYRLASEIWENREDFWNKEDLKARDEYVRRERETALQRIINEYKDGLGKQVIDERVRRKKEKEELAKADKAE